MGERNAEDRASRAAQSDCENREIEQGRDRRRPDGLHLDLEEPAHLLDIKGLEASPIDALQHRLARREAHPIVRLVVHRAALSAEIAGRKELEQICKCRGPKSASNA